MSKILVSAILCFSLFFYSINANAWLLISYAIAKNKTYSNYEKQQNSYQTNLTQGKSSDERLEELFDILLVFGVVCFIFFPCFLNETNSQVKLIDHDALINNGYSEEEIQELIKGQEFLANELRTFRKVSSSSSEIIDSHTVMNVAKNMGRRLPLIYQEFIELQ